MSFAQPITTNHRWLPLAILTLMAYFFAPLTTLISMNKHTMKYLSDHAHSNVGVLKKIIIKEPYLVLAVSKNKQLFEFATKQKIKVYQNTTSKEEVKK